MINSREHIFLADLFRNSEEFSALNSEESFSIINELVYLYFLKVPIVAKDINNLLVEVFFEILSKNESDFLDFLISNQEENFESDLFNSLKENKYEALILKIDEKQLLVKALQQLERENLRTKFKELDENEADFLNESEIKSAFIQLERKALKEKFSELDKNESSNNRIANASFSHHATSDSNSFSEHSSSNKKSFSVFNLLKYAAILIAIILPFYFINNWNANKNQVSKKNHPKEKEKIDSIISNKINKSIPEEIIDIKLEKILQANVKVIEKESFGFSSKDKNISLEISVLDFEEAHQKLKKLEALIKKKGVNFEKHKTQLKELNKKIKLHSNRYIFDLEKEKCKLYIDSKFHKENGSESKIYFLEDGNSKNYYLKTLDYYNLNSSNKLEKLNLINDIDIIEKLDLLEE